MVQTLGSATMVVPLIAILESIAIAKAFGMYIFIYFFDINIQIILTKNNLCNQ